MKLNFSGKLYNKTPFQSEKELEKAVLENSEEIFGKNRIYIDVKKRIKNRKNSFISIPDGYLLDLKPRQSKLWVVENELSRHDSFNHVGIQLLKFASQFQEGSYFIKEFLYKVISENIRIKKKIEKVDFGFSNLSDLLDYAIFRNDFGFIVVIDEITDDLAGVTRELAKQPELIEIQKFSNGKESIYIFDEFLQELTEAKSTKVKDVEDIDTMVAPARPDGHRDAFLKEKIWYAVRISPSIIPKLKYLAMYEVKPISSIRWVGKIESIKPYEDTGKYKLFLSEIMKIPEIKMNDPKNAPQSPRYTRFDLLQKAKTLSDIF